MTTAFVFDTKLYKRGNDYYAMTLTNDFFCERYLDKTDNLIVITRSEDIKNVVGNIDGYKKTNSEKVVVSPVFRYNSIPDIFTKHRSIVKEMESNLKKCDNAIIRMPSVLGVVACDICRRKHIPYLIEMVACAWDGYMNHTNLTGKLVAPFMFLCTRKKVRESLWTIYVTNQFLQKRYPTRGKSFSCSDVVISDEKKVLKKIKSREFDKFNFKMCTVANVGMKYKGHKYALLAMKKLKDDGINIKYFLAGNGDQNYLRKYVEQFDLKDSVIFLGSLSHEEVFKLLDDIDIYIQPSLQEGLPRALIEAMSRGCCCIGSTAGGIPELLNKDYIFKKKNVKELVDILKRLNKEDVIIERVNNYEKAQEYTRSKLNKKRNDIYNDFFHSIENDNEVGMND